MIGNGQIIPAGPLRESLNAIQRADCIIINGDKNLEFEEKILNLKVIKNYIYFIQNIKLKILKNLKIRQLLHLQE